MNPRNGADGGQDHPLRGADWEISTPDEQISREQLCAAGPERMRDPANADSQVAAVREHLTEGLIDGVYELDAETSASIHRSLDEDQLSRTIAHIDRRRKGQD